MCEAAAIAALVVGAASYSNQRTAIRKQENAASRALQQQLELNPKTESAKKVFGASDQAAAVRRRFLAGQGSAGTIRTGALGVVGSPVTTDKTLLGQ